MPNEQLEERLKEYANAICTNVEDVISVKFRPVMSGAQYTDPFGYQDANAYTYPSEYEAGKKVVELSDPKHTLVKRLAPTIFHPLPRDKPCIWKMDNTQSDVLWIQHETGLEILGDIDAVLSICYTLWQIYTAIRKKIQENKKKSKSDRYYHDIEHYRVEIRMMDKNGKLHQLLVIRLPIDAELSFEILKEEIHVKLKGNG